MANDEKFGITVELNTGDAEKKLDDLGAKADKVTSKTKKSSEVKVKTGEAVKEVKTLEEKLLDVLEVIAKKYSVEVDPQPAIESISKIELKIEEMAKILEKTGKQTDNVFSFIKIGAAVEAIKLVTNAVKEAYDMVSDTASEITTLGNNAAGLGMTANDLKAYQTSFEGMGMSGADANHVLGTIQDKLLGQIYNPSVQVSSAFGMMGINTRQANGENRAPDKVLDDIIKVFKRMPTQQAMAMGGQIGINRDEVVALRNSKSWDSFLDKQKKKPVVTEKEQEQARSFKLEQADFGSSIQQIKNSALMPFAETISKNVIPELTKFAAMLADLTANNASKVTDVINNPSKAANGVMQNVADWGANHMPQKEALDTIRERLQKTPGFSKGGVDWWDKILDWAQVQVEGGGKSQVGYKMKKGLDGKMHNVLDSKGKPIPEAFGQRQIQPAVASEVMGYNVTPEMLMDNTFNKKVRDKLMTKWEKQYGSQGAALAYYNGGTPGLKQYQKTGHTAYTDKVAAQVSSGAALNILNRAPVTSTQSSSVINNVNNQRVSSSSSTTHIGALNVVANDVQELSRQIQGQASYLDRINTSSGRSL